MSQLALLAVGVVAGATVRWLVGQLGGETATLLVVNTVGCAVIGLLLNSPPRIAMAIGTGFCGGLTTFSGLALALAQRLDQGRVVAAMSLTVATVVCCGLALAAAQRTINTGSRRR